LLIHFHLIDLIVVQSYPYGTTSQWRTDEEWRLPKQGYCVTIQYS